VEVESNKHATSRLTNNSLHVHVLTSLNFVPWPDGTETIMANLDALCFEIFH